MTWYEILFLKYLKGLPSRINLLLRTYVNGTEQLLPVNDDEPETSPILCDIQYPDTLRNDQYFTYRESPTTKDGLAKIRGIRGNTLVWNQRCKTLVSGNWAAISIGTGSLTFADGVATFSTTQNYGRFLYTPGDLVNGHKYLLSVEIKGYANAVIDYGLGTQTTYANQGCYLHTGVIADTNWHRYLKIGTFTSGTDDKVLVENASGAENLGEIQVRNIMYFDLTQMGLDVTENEFVSLFPLSMYTRDLGSLLSFNGTGIKVTGKNLLDVSNASNATNVVSSVSDGVINIKDVSSAKWSNSYIGVFYLEKGKTYTISASNIVYGRFGISNTQSYPTSSNVPSISNISNATSVNLLTSDKLSTSFKSDEYQTIYLFFCTDKEIENHKAYSLTIQVESGSTATSYEPYTTSTTSLPISTYFPTGMKSAGSVYDELTPTKAITRIGAVDLGSLTWTTANTSANLYQADITGMKVPSARNADGIICAKYPISSSTSLGTATDDKSMLRDTSTAKLYIRDTSYSSASNFKTAMSGVYLFYELATPTEQNVSPEDTQVMLNQALSTILGRSVSVQNPQEPLDILTKGE